MLKLSKLTDYATGILSHMAKNPSKIYTARDITTETHVSLPTVMKLMKQLTKAKLLNSQRGSNGGYYLANKPEVIYLIDIVSAIEGNLGLTECSIKDSHCSLEPICTTRDNWQTISQLLYDALGQITLAQMARPLKMQRFQIELAGKPFTTEIHLSNPSGV